MQLRWYVLLSGWGGPKKVAFVAEHEIDPDTCR